MGQYYIPVIRRRTNNKHVKTLCVFSHEYDNGLKLMEHSYIENNFVNIVLNELVNNPARVIWFGDYSGPKDIPGLNKHQFKALYQKVWESDPYSASDRIFIHAKDALEEFDFDDESYLVNHSKKVFIDLKKYKLEAPEASLFAERTEGWKINPLPLLTASSNGRGRGDYFPESGFENNVGAWVNDLLEVKWDKPENYEEVQYFFREQ